MTLSRLFTLSIFSLCNLDIGLINSMIELIDFMYDAAHLTRCYTQHALGPYIDSQINQLDI